MTQTDIPCSWIGRTLLKWLLCILTLSSQTSTWYRFFLKRLPKNNNKLSLSSILLLSYHTWQERFGHHTSERADSHHPLVTSFKQHFNHYSLVSTPTAPWKWPFGSNCQHLGWHIFWLALSKSSVFWTSLKLLWHFFILTSLTFIFPFSSTT